MTKSNILIEEPVRTEIIGVPISTVSMKSAIDFIGNNLERIRGSYICAANVHTTVMAHDDADYRRIQSDSILTLPDGKPLSVIGKKQGFSQMEKVTGTHFMMNILTDLRFKDKRHYFYGTDNDNLNKMIVNIKSQYPNAIIAGFQPSVFRELTNEEVSILENDINLCRPDFIWIGIGAPRQEILMDRMKDQVSGVMIGVGGAFNIFSGKVSNAPAWVQNIGMEWFYRLCKEPKRLFKRYTETNAKFLYYYFIKNRG